MRAASWLAGLALLVVAGRAPAQERWSESRAQAWGAAHGWLVGMNYAPRSAINQLEMWQADTFDPATIDQELGWAHDIGYNSARVFLHDLLWQQDSLGFLQRMDRFLATADRHGIGVMFVLLDGVWNPEPRLGTQPEPRKHVHNSGWVQSPGAAFLQDSAHYDRLAPYVTGVLRRFANDPRVIAWDLFNEPDNADRILTDKVKPVLALALLRRVTGWAREVNPSQPLTVGIWWGEWRDTTTWAPIQQYSLEHSDIVTFHHYGDSAAVRRNMPALLRQGRPVVCTEYMARHQQSTFATVLPLFRELGIGAINWGFVSGKTNTIFPWDSWTKPYPDDPTPWFHDVLRPDGTPYDSAEVALIRRLTRP